ncbi:MAG: HAMP domain-containing histidine kinase [Oscillospiraceae bacterium]|nr:HAMP domain-containing histidine kinase [Oscillospiraceae bacterium]
MFKSLKIKLLLAGIGTLLLLLVGVWGIAWRHYVLAGAMIVLTCFAVIALLLWFWRHVTDPIERLTDFADTIASGSYGSQMERSEDDEIGRLTDAINHMSQQVAMAEKTRTEFISQVSHELRTPLTAITGWAETIAYDEAVQGDSLRGIQIISREAERLTGMVMELLEFTRIQDGRFNLRIELLDISAELEDALFTYGELMRQAGLELDYEPSPTEIPLIPGDPERLKQVFLNLLDNASKHGGDGKKVDVAIEQKADKVQITVRDYGHGIPEAELPHVKERFYKGSSKNRGTGIGLAVCDEIVTRHGGKLLVENAEGGGCRVTVILPMETK